MTGNVGIIAFGSLIDDPGPELAASIVDRQKDVITPFAVEFARQSHTRSGGPTLVPVAQNGSQVKATILILDLSEDEAKDRLWRRETRNVGQGGRYRASADPGPNALIIESYPKFAGLPLVLAARFQPNVSPLTAERLAELAIESARSRSDGKDGISYLIDARRNGIVTPLSEPYEQVILRRTGAITLAEALTRTRMDAKLRADR